MTAGLRLDGVAIGHAAGEALIRDVDLAIAPGDVVCLMGPNGIGKTTLLRTALGFLPPLAGRVRVDGLDVAGAPAAAIARRIAYVPQSYLGDPGHTVFDVVLMGRTARLGLFAVPDRADQAAAVAAIETMGLADVAGRTTDRISGGQRQLMLIARALAQETRIVVMDEPTSSLDLGNRFALVDRIRAMAAAGHAVLVATHEPEQAFDLGDRAAVLGQDRSFVVGPVDDVLTTARLRRLYRADVALETTPGGRRVVGRAPPAPSSRPDRTPETTP
ncbi:MAG: ABC transporter ATP-binding protein [Phyllobacteriaceae bacterium]|nr:ABC transporter ATP-binding protein [Phyllobacteriaceae bacterium]